MNLAERHHPPGISFLFDRRNPRGHPSDISALQARARETALSREQRELFREEINVWWEKASARIASGRVARVQELETWIEKNNALKEVIEDEIEELERQIEEAWNGDWAERRRKVVARMREKVASLKEKVADLRRRIRELQARGD